MSAILAASLDVPHRHSGAGPLLSGENQSCEEPRLKTIQLFALTPSSVAYFSFGIKALE
jgi:hypothetical protein